MNFQIRCTCINKEIIFARNEAIKTGKFDKTLEPFSVRQKQFFSINETKKVYLILKLNFNKEKLA